MASLYKRKRSPYFWIKVKRSGHWIRESTGLRTDVAPDIRRARILEADETAREMRECGTDHTGATSWQWVTNWIKARYSASPVSCERYLSAWNTISLFLTEQTIDAPINLQRSHCFDYMAWRQKPNKSKGKYKAGHNTALLELKLLRLVMQEAVERGLAQGNPCVKLGLKKERQRLKPELTQDDIDLILAEIDKIPDPGEQQFFRNSFMIARYQGCRLTETRLDPRRDVEISGDVGAITFRIKGGRDHTAPLHPELIPFFLDLQRRNATATWQIPAGRGRQWASSMWTNFMERIGLKSRGVSFHCTRVTVVTEMARADVPESKAQRFIGHASTTVHRIYQRLQLGDLAGATSAVGGKRPKS